MNAIDELTIRISINLIQFNENEKWYAAFTLNNTKTKTKKKSTRKQVLIRTRRETVSLRASTGSLR